MGQTETDDVLKVIATYAVSDISFGEDALNRARTAAERSIKALRGDATLELVALDLRIAVAAVGEIVGKTTTEDLLDSIFGQFCIGK